MKTRIKEESVLFVSVFKWLVLATVISQVLAIKKSASIEVETGKELETASPRYRMRDKSLIRVLRHLRAPAGKPTGDDNDKK